MTSAVTFFAPSFEVVFFAPRILALRGPVVVVFRRAADVVILLAGGFASEAESDLARGEADLEISLPLALAFRKGEEVRPTTGGVPVRDTGGVGFLIEGLSHEEKKSSAGSLAGVEEAPAPSPATSVTTTSLGYLIAQARQSCLNKLGVNKVDSLNGI